MRVRFAILARMIRIGAERFEGSPRLPPLDTTAHPRMMMLVKSITYLLMCSLLFLFFLSNKQKLKPSLKNQTAEAAAAGNEQERASHDTNSQKVEKQRVS